MPRAKTKDEVEVTSTTPAASQEEPTTEAKSAQKGTAPKTMEELRVYLCCTSKGCFSNGSYYR